VIFYLGVHRPPWLRLMYEKLPFEKKPRAVPLFLSYSTLGSLGRLPRAVSRWALDSGAYTELTHHGQWRIGARAYAAGVQRIRTTVGNMDWAGPQDWTCDKKSLAMSGLTVLDHQKRTTRNLLDLWNLGAPVIPVLQGWTADDYERHIEAYGKAGVDLHSAPLVGVGSVAGRQQTKFTWDLLAMLKARYGLRIHAFGLKRVGLINSARYIASADSMGWSGEARRERASDPARRGHEGQHASCANCIEKALEWRAEMLDIIRSQGVKVENGLVVTADQIIKHTGAGAVCHIPSARARGRAAAGEVLFESVRESVLGRRRRAG